MSKKGQESRHETHETHNDSEAGPSFEKRNQEDETNENSPRNSNHISYKNIRFDDIHSSFKKFNGKSDINNWIRHFCDLSEIFELNELEKFIYAKKLLIETAELWAKFESESTNFRELLIELRDEFQKSTNSAIIHEKLKQRKSIKMNRR